MTTAPTPYPAGTRSAVSGTISEKYRTVLKAYFIKTPIRPGGYWVDENGVWKP